MEQARLKPECIKCLIRGQLDRHPSDITEQEKTDYMQSVLKLIANAKRSVSAPSIVRSIYALQKEMFGYERDFSEIKKHFNEVMLAREGQIAGELEASPDALRLGIQYAMTGNYIDFGAMEHVDEEKLKQLLNSAKDNPIDEEGYQALKADLLRAEKIVYITDNCGEIVLDKLLIQVIRKLNPAVSVTAIVRGEAVVNDATMEDALQVGLTEIAGVIGNGSNVGGTCLDEISEQARAAIDTADVILAKGQGNFETMSECGKNVYYIFMCKCDMFAKRFAVPLYTGLLVNDKNLS
ncbi:MAG: ARMT1-like domain-containing protein [Lachnospiraceae bacterium]|nr:ARMT1-like domain-containing protein [Lachnospiraceae bacterium]